MLVHDISELIGNTPLLCLDPAVHGLKNVQLYAKLEYLNPFGSVKDRVAWGLLREEFPRLQEEGGAVIESSSGNTAKAMQLLCSTRGVPFRVATNRIKVQETKEVLKLLGADIEELPGRSDCHDPNDPHDPQRFIERLVEQEGGKLLNPNQYWNQRNVDTHQRTTGEEIVRDIGKVDFLFGTLGTSGSTRGTAQRLLQENPNLKTIGIATERNDFLPGIRNENELFEVGLFAKDFYSDILRQSSASAIEGMLTLIRKYGVLGGPTSGACYQAALEYLRTADADARSPIRAVIIVCDRTEPYLSFVRTRRPDLFHEQAATDSFHRLRREVGTLAPTISPNEAEAFLRTQQPLVIDVRGNITFRAGHIPGSINIPDSLFEKLIDSSQPFSPTQRLLIVCPVGVQSAEFAGYLRARGCQAWSLESGIVGWRDAGLQLERSPKMEKKGETAHA